MKNESDYHSDGQCEGPSPFAPHSGLPHYSRDLEEIDMQDLIGKFPDTLPIGSLGPFIADADVS